MLTAKQAHTVRALSSLHAILINNLNTMRQKQSSAYFTRLHFLGHPLRPNTATPFSWDMQTQGRHYSLLWHSCFTPNCSFSSICIVVVIICCTITPPTCNSALPLLVGLGEGGGGLWGLSSREAEPPQLRNQMVRSGLQLSGDAPHRLGTPHGRPNVRSGSRN